MYNPSPASGLVVIDDTLSAKNAKEDHQELRIWLKPRQNTRMGGWQKRIEEAWHHISVCVAAVGAP